ncbi:site-specific recombinase, phage integrase family [Ancylostoma duodenale]|uniref:Site-specific recombinase, phage integrase family n=1 Tax=Ancylostoma duodenale TaxID=51022 RepID=A0A0C2D4N2_9BILA|nr:site-specific recombinase, phage integrase family [Ancylostoma duodenale]
MGRGEDEKMEWFILDEIVKSKKRAEIARPQSFATTDQWLQLLQVADQLQWPTWRADRAKILLTFLFCALMRVSEAVGVRFSDLTEEGENWKIEIPKSKSDQEGQGAAIFLTKQPWFDEALKRMENRHNSTYVLAAANGGKWSANAASSEIRRMCEAAQINGLSPHSFRRGGAMRAIDGGVEQQAVQRRGRWANPKSMSPYIRHSLASQGGPATLIA